MARPSSSVDVLQRRGRLRGRGQHRRADPSFVDRRRGRLPPRAPARRRSTPANNNAVGEDIETDLAGAPRFVDDPDTEDTGVGDAADRRHGSLRVPGRRLPRRTLTATASTEHPRLRRLPVRLAVRRTPPPTATSTECLQHPRLRLLPADLRRGMQVGARATRRGGHPHPPRPSRSWISINGANRCTERLSPSAPPPARAPTS